MQIPSFIKYALQVQELYMLFLELNLLAIGINQVIAFLVQKKPISIDVVNQFIKNNLLRFGSLKAEYFLIL